MPRAQAERQWLRNGSRQKSFRDKKALNHHRERI
jgi:hypothetical protein